MDHKIFQLENGLRVLFRPSSSSITHTCIVINVGSRHEIQGKFGTAHFIEHLLFKRTERRNTNQILNRLEEVGGDLNAYTTKEYTCIHASILNPYLDRALDLFEDIIFHSVFPEDEMEKERGVIFDEMASYLDSPEEAIMDDFEDLIFSKSGLGHNILGLENDLKGILQEDIKQFISQHYVTSNMAIAISGNYTEAQVLKLVNKLFGYLKSQSLEIIKDDFNAVPAQIIEQKRPINQTHYVLGNLGYNIYDNRKTSLLLLNNIIGGYGMSSILNLKIREKYGIAYTIESNYSLYSDTGLFSIYFGTDEEKADKALRLVLKELKSLREQPLTAHFLEKAKSKFKGQIALAEESRMSLIIAEAKNILDYNRIVSLQEVFDNIDRTSVKGLQEIANEVLDERNFTHLSFVPED